MSEHLEIVVTPERTYFYSDDSNFGIFACSMAEETRDSINIELSNYGDFTIKGVMPPLEFGKKYKAKVVPKRDKKYGLGYEVVTIYELFASSKQEEEMFLRTFLTKRQVDEMVKAYPEESIVELIVKEKFDYKKVKYLGDKNYFQIKERILENLEYQEAIVELCEKYGLSHKIIKKMSAHYNSPTLLVQKIKENPYILADDVKGIGFLKADEIALRNGIEENSPFRLKACLMYTLKEKANEGHSYITKKGLAMMASKTLGIRMKELTAFIEGLNEEHTEFYIKDNVIALRHNYEVEASIAKHIKRLMSFENRLHINNLEQKIEDVELEQGFPFTGEQREAIIMALEKNCLIVNGKAGTGKTSVLLGVMKVLLSADPLLIYNTCALSGKASLRIQESTKLHSCTIHRLLGYKPNGGFVRNEDDPLHSDIVVLDEASMVNIHIMEKLVSSIKDGAKFICLGDTSQLEPIGCGNAFYDLIKTETVPRVELTKVHRQAMKSGILSVANKVREGLQFVDEYDYERKKIGELKDLHFFPFRKSSSVLNTVLSLSKRYDGDIMDYQVIVPMKSRGSICTKELNAHLQEIFNPADLQKPFLKKGKLEFREKDKLIQNGNNYDKGVLNGSLGIVQMVDTIQKVLFVKFEGIPEIVEYKSDELGELDLAYSLTVHRTQGSQFKNVVFAIDNSSYIMLSRQLVYTGLTRAIKNCFLVCELDAIRHSVQTDKSTKRRTFLPELLLAP